MNNKKIFFVSISLIFSTLLLLSSLTFVYAQDRLPLVVAPARQQIAIDPGKKESLIIKFFNESEVPVSGIIKAVDFIVKGSDGKPILLEENPVLPATGRYSASNWIKLPYERAAIPAGAVLKVQFDINVPQDALAGGRYVAVYFEQTGYDIGTSATLFRQGESAVSPRIVGLVNIKVNGPVTEGASVQKFSAPGFAEYGPVTVSTEIFNSGNYHITPQGQISLFDFMGREIAVVPLEEKNIFPDSSRTYETEIGPKLLLGKFKLTLNAAYGETGQALTASAYIWIIPWKMILAVVLGIIIIITLVYIFWNKLKKKEKELEHKLEEEISEIETLKNKYKDAVDEK
ncbi:MAG: hypothetical protein Q8P91_02750 [bacterium]|nr:hypothetical protein [bacterium]